MKKGLLIALGLLVAFGTICFADTVAGTSRLEYSILIKNETGEGLAKTEITPTTSVRPNVDKLVGYDCRTLAEGEENPETFIGIFDGTDALLSGECFGEGEANGKESIHDDWPRGKKIVNGVVTRIGSQTEAQLFFIRE